LHYAFEADSTGACTAGDGTLLFDYTYSATADTLSFVEDYYTEKLAYEVTSSTLTLSGKDATGYFSVNLTLKRQ